MAVAPDQRWPREIVVDRGDGTVSLLQDVKTVDWTRVRSRRAGDVVRPAEAVMDCFASLAMTNAEAA